MGSKTYYTDELYNKLQINFVEIELVCNQCTLAFLSQSPLLKQIKNGCIFLQKSVAKIGSSLSLARAILKSTAKLSAPESGLVLRG